MIIGYARISTGDQCTHSQTDTLNKFGAERIFSDVIFSASRSRPKINAILKQLRNGDVVIVTKYDRLARSLQDLLAIVDMIKERGTNFRSLAERTSTRRLLPVSQPFISLRQSLSLSASESQRTHERRA